MTTSRFVFAHFSDVHLGPLSLPATRYWNVKRGLGFLNWHRKRRSVHKPDVIAMLLDDLKRQDSDHVVVTGDLINIGLPAEYEAAAAWLKTVGGPHDVSVVPGNHDIYTRLASHPGVGLWRDYMTGEMRQAGGGSPGEGGRSGLPGEGSGEAGTGGLSFPYVRRRGPVVFIGVNSAEPTPPFVAAGAVGAAQLRRLGETLRWLKDDAPDLFKVVLIHHPPLPGQAPPRRALKDAAELEKILAQYSPELVLHGHNHRDTLIWSGESGATGDAAHAGGDCRQRGVPVIGIASGSAVRIHGSECLARYNLITVEAMGSGEGAARASAGLEGVGEPVSGSAEGVPWRVEVVGRGLLSPGGQVGEIDRYRLC